MIALCWETNLQSRRLSVKVSIFSITGNKLIEDCIGSLIERKGDIKKVLKKFKKKIENLKEYETPTLTGIHVIQCNAKEEMILEEEQMKFRSGPTANPSPNCQ